MAQLSEVEDVESRNQGWRRQGWRTGHHGVILFVSNSHGGVKTDDADKLQQALELDISNYGEDVYFVTEVIKGDFDEFIPILKNF